MKSLDIFDRISSLLKRLTLDYDLDDSEGGDLGHVADEINLVREKYVDRRLGPLDRNSQGGKGATTIFCACGRQIWYDLRDYQKREMTLADVEKHAICSDCIIEKAKKRCDSEDLTP